MRELDIVWNNKANTLQKILKFISSDYVFVLNFEYFDDSLEKISDLSIPTLDQLYYLKKGMGDS